MAVFVHADGDHGGDVLAGTALASLQTMPSTWTYGCSRARGGLRLHSSAALQALSSGLEAVLVETPARPAGFRRRPRCGAWTSRPNASRWRPLDAGPAPFAALDNRSRESHPLELGHSKRDLARRRCEPALVVPDARYAALSSVRSQGAAPASRQASSSSMALMVSSMVFPTD